MSGTSLSDLWRENRSKDPGTDLASILDGARIIAQSLNPKTEVTFSGVDMATTDRKRIYLSPRDLLALNEYPAPGDTVDCLLGLTVHEVGHTLFSEDKVSYTDKLANKVQCQWSDRKIFGDLVNIFEDIYVDHLMTAYPGYRDYLYRERAHALGKFNPDSVAKPLKTKSTRMDMLNAMIYLTLAGGKVPSGISDDNMNILGKIATYATKMCTKKTSKQNAILGAWRTLKELPTILPKEVRGFGALAPEPEATTTKPEAETDEGEAEPEAQPVSEQAQEDKASEQEEQEELEEKEQGEEGEEAGDEEQEAEKETGEGFEGGAGEEVEPGIEPELDLDLDLASQLNTLVEDTSRLPKDLAEDVSEAIVEKRADLSQLLSLLAKDSRYTILAYTPGEDAGRAAEARSQTSVAEEKLRRILQDYRLRRTRDYRGLMSGRISGRRLHRVAYGDQRVFQRRERPEGIDMVAELVMDLSGSVSAKRDLIEQITCATCDAFQKEKMEFMAIGYSEDYDVVNIPRLYDREVGRVNLDLRKEWGMTPSYEGLAAGIAQLLRLGGNKQKILFHFTDGQPNVRGRRTIPELLDEARGKGIIDIHVCLTGYDATTEQFKALYGEDTMFISDINQLPDIVDQELRKRLKV